MSFALTISNWSFNLASSVVCSTFQIDKDSEDCASRVNWVGAMLIAGLANVLFARWENRQVKPLTVQDCVKDPHKIFTLTRAKDGKSPVYLGPHFVVKEKMAYADQDMFGVDRSQKIFFANVAISRNKFSHLIVPKIQGEIDGKFLFEERLPIHVDESQNIYRQHRDAFTPAVKEFVHLLIRCQFADLLSRHNNFHCFVTPVPRYDNVCPYVEKGVGKLGLVDLEHFDNDRWRRSVPDDFGVKVNYCDIDTCATLIHLFPLHFEEIIEIMQINGLQLSEEVLQRLRVAQNAQIQQREKGGIEVVSSGTLHPLY